MKEKEIRMETASQRRHKFIKAEIERLNAEIEGYKREIEITKQMCAVFKAEIKKACEKYGIPEPDLGEDPEEQP